MVNYNMEKISDNTLTHKFTIVRLNQNDPTRFYELHLLGQEISRRFCERVK